LTSLESLEAPPETARAWAVAWAAFAANFVTFGVLFSFGVYLTPIAEGFDTTTGPVSPLFSAAVLVYYFAGAVGGRLGDRYGARLVVLVGAITISVALYAAANTNELWQLYLVFPVVGIAVGCCYPPLIGAVGRRFEQRRVMAIAIVLAGVGAGTWIMPVVARRLIDDRGWRGTFEIWALATLLVILIVAATLGPGRSSDADEHVPVRARQLVRTRPFVRLYVAVVLVSPGFYAPLAFLNDYAVARDIDEASAAWLVGIIGGSTVVARFTIGALGPRFDPLRQYRASYWVMTAGLVVWLLAGGSYTALVVTASLHGIGWAVWVTAAPMVLTRWFGPRDLGGVLGAFYTGLGLGALLGPAVSGFVIDRSGYRWAIAMVVVANVAAIAVSRSVHHEVEP
jgi:MFS family permease